MWHMKREYLNIDDDPIRCWRIPYARKHYTIWVNNWWPDNGEITYYLGKHDMNSNRDLNFERIVSVNTLEKLIMNINLRGIRFSDIHLSVPVSESLKIERAITGRDHNGHGYSKTIIDK